MSRYLLDVNVVLGLLDPHHTFHNPAHAWAASEPGAVWLTCPIVQNAVVRVAGHSSYPSRIGTPADVRRILREFCADPRHEFCPDDISLLDDSHVAHPELLTPKGLTDAYLLALAAHHEARLATFDRHVRVDSIHGGAGAVEVLGT